jgi:hypothetical protein
MTRARKQPPAINIQSPASPLLSNTNLEAKRVQTRASRSKRRATQDEACAAIDPDDLRVQALFSMPAFAELIEFHGGWENFGDCHTELTAFLSKPQLDKEAQKMLRLTGDERQIGLRRLVLMPRGHLKSTIGTTLYTMWRLYRNPELRIFVGSNKQNLSHSFIRELRQYFENEELQTKVWNNRPHLSGNLVPELNKRSRERNRNNDPNETEALDRKLIWNNNAIQVNREGRFKEPSVFAGCIGATETGQHYDLIIMDDVIDFVNTESEVKKRRTEEWIADIESVINPVKLVELPLVGNDVVGGEVVISGTRYAVDDYYAYLLERLEELEYVAHIRNIYNNGVDDSDGYLWHQRYNANVISRLKTRISPRRFSSQYLNTVYEKDVALLDVKACDVVPHSNFSTRGDMCYFEHAGIVHHVQPIICVDPAFSAGKNGDDCAIVVGFKLSNGKTVVIDAALDRMDATEVVKTCMAFATTYKTLRLFHEANGVGLLLPELFKGQDTTVGGKRMVVNSHYEQRPKEAKIQGVLELPFALGSFVFSDKVWSNERIFKQMSQYPAVRHDDFLDGLVTLYEKAICLRSTHNYSQQNRSLIFNLGIDYALETATQPKPSFLGEYNAYFK